MTYYTVTITLQHCMTRVLPWTCPGVTQGQVTKCCKTLSTGSFEADEPTEFRLSLVSLKQRFAHCEYIKNMQKSFKMFPLYEPPNETKSVIYKNYLCFISPEGMKQTEVFNTTLLRHSNL